MCNLNDIYNEIIEKKAISILGQKYEVKNCIIAMDEKLLKVSVQLACGDSELTVFTELKNFSKLRNED